MSENRTERSLLSVRDSARYLASSLRVTSSHGRDPGFLEQAISVYAWGTKVSFALFRFAAAIWRHAWEKANTWFASSSVRSSPGEVLWCRFEFSAAILSAISFAFWRIQDDPNVNTFLGWIHNLAVSVAVCLGSMVVSVVWILARGPKASYPERLQSARAPAIAAVRYAALLAPAVIVPHLFVAIWSGEMLQVSAATAVLFLPASYWLVMWLRSSMLVSSNRFLTRGLDTELSSLTAMIVGAVTFGSSIRGVMAHGFDPNEGGPLAVAISLAGPAILLATGALDHRGFQVAGFRPSWRRIGG